MFQFAKKAVALGVVIASAGMLVSAAAAADAPGRAGKQVASAQAGPDGQRSHTRTTTRQRTSSGHTRSDVVTGANGNTRRRDASVVNDPAAGTRTRDVIHTGPDGQTRTTQSTAQRTDDGFERDVIYTGKDGQTATKSIDVTKDADSGTTTRQVTFERDVAAP